MTKPNKDGWIRHRGGKCPVEADAMVEVRLRDGTEYTGDDAENGDYWEWSHAGKPSDLMAWRPNKPEQQNVIGFMGVDEIPTKEGWIPHDGGKCSAPELSVVEVRLRNGAVLPAHDCERFTWEHSAVETDRQIMAYRVVDMREPVRYDDDYCDCDCDCDCHGPIIWRDRIREIDETIIYLSEERASLVAWLKEEGFTLIQSDEPNSGEESAQQDMGNPANWRVGDIFVIVENKKDDHEFLEGTIVRFTGFDDGGDDYVGTFEYQDGRDYWFCKKESVKWHSRPTN